MRRARFNSFISHPMHVFAAVLSRSPSSDGVAVLLDTMNRLMPSSSANVTDGANQASMLNAYNAEGHLRLVEVLLVPLSSEVVVSLWQSLDAVGASAIICTISVLFSCSGIAALHEPPCQHRQAASQPTVGKDCGQAQQQWCCASTQRCSIHHVCSCALWNRRCNTRWYFQQQK